jgi:CMP-N-acetylneuraminic acid synthetase
MSIVGITPARGGSKGILRKNIKPIAGKPLISWTIESALASKFIDKYFVSTEDKEIAKISKDYGAEVIDRPPELATDTSLVIDTLQHAVKTVPHDVMVLLQCTSPIRNEGRIDECIKYHIHNHYFHSSATGWMCKYMEYGSNTQRRQDYDGYFYDDGNVYCIYTGLIKKGLLFDNEKGQIKISKEENLEIDDDFDFWMAEQILLRRMKK